MELEIFVDTDDKLCATIQAFLNKGFKTICGPQFLTAKWSNIKGIEVFGKSDWAQLNKMSQETIFDHYILPRLHDANRLFCTYFDSLIPDPQSIVKVSFPKLIEYAFAKKILIIPISDEKFPSHHRINKYKSIVLFKPKTVPDLLDIGIKDEEQYILSLAHEIGHSVLHYYYQSGFKTETKQPLEYIFFNEKMAWHVANDLLLQYCSSLDTTKLIKQQEYSLREYERYYSSKNTEEYFEFNSL